MFPSTIENTCVKDDNRVGFSCSLFLCPRVHQSMVDRKVSQVTLLIACLGSRHLIFLFQVLIDAVMTSTQREITEAKQAFQKLFKKDMTKVISSDISGDYEKIILKICEGSLSLTFAFPMCSLLFFSYGLE